MTNYYCRATDRSLFRLAGEEIESFLQGLITQDIQKLNLEQSVYSCLLTPQGKIIADFFLYKIESGIILDCDHSVAETLHKKLRLYKLRAKVEIAPYSEHEVTLNWSRNDENIEGTADPRLNRLGSRTLLSASSSPQGEEASLKDYQTHCAILGIPQFGIDFETEKVFPLDLNFDVLNGVDYKKGCFVGQEVASRMKRKGEIRKRLWIAQFEGDTPTVGEAIKATETTIGSISSVIGNAALAHVRLDRLAKVEPPFITEGGISVTLEQPTYLKEVE